MHAYKRILKWQPFMKRVYNSTDYMKFSVSLVNHLHREGEETRIFSRMIKTVQTDLFELAQCLK